jgi:hypothetical protein
VNVGGFYDITRSKVSGESVTVFERNHVAINTQEPLMCLLKYTVAITSVLLENSIQARLGGFRLYTTVEDLHEVLTEASNKVVVQINRGEIVIGNNLGVVEFPVLIVSDGGVHQALDLTHCDGCGVCGGGRFPPPDEPKLQEIGVEIKGLWTVF